MNPTPKMWGQSHYYGACPPNMGIYLFDHAVKMLIERPAPILEVGTDYGGSALLFLDALAQTKADTFLVTVDPWGFKPYPTGQPIYGDNRQEFALSLLAAWARSLHVRWHHFKMNSVDFLEHVQHLGCWYNGKHMPYEWGMVFLDGEHIWDTVRKEVETLNMAPGGHIIIDNAMHTQLDGSDLPTLLHQNYKGEMFHYNDNDAAFTVNPT